MFPGSLLNYFIQQPMLGENRGNPMNKDPLKTQIPQGKGLCHLTSKEPYSAELLAEGRNKIGGGGKK